MTLIAGAGGAKGFAIVHGCGCVFLEVTPNVTLADVKKLADSVKDLRQRLIAGKGAGNGSEYLH